MAQRQPGFFDEQHKLDRISKLGDPLEKLNGSIRWSLFEPLLKRITEKEAKGPGGRPAYDALMMFKIMILQEYFGLSDEQAEFQISDRFSFMRFLNLRSCDQVPDSTTIWNFREQLKSGSAMKEFFKVFGRELQRLGMIVNKGKIIDASIVEAPRQRNSRDENRQIKDGEIPPSWNDEPQKLAHKDTDARWTQKHGKTFYGYKNSVRVDAKKKFIDDYEVSTASEHDSVAGKKLLRGCRRQRLYADSAYTGKEFAGALARRGWVNKICEKGYRNRPLTERQKKSNRVKSKVRARVEHVFGFLVKARGRVLVRTIGLARAKVKIGLMNLVYNMFRCALYYRPLAV